MDPDNSLEIGLKERSNSSLLGIAGKQVGPLMLYIVPMDVRYRFNPLKMIGERWKRMIHLETAL